MRSALQSERSEIADRLVRPRRRQPRVAREPADHRHDLEVHELRLGEGLAAETIAGDRASAPSSTSTVTTTPASTTITIVADQPRRLAQWRPATAAVTDAIEHLVERRFAGARDEARPEVLLQRLVGLGRTSPERPESLLRPSSTRIVGIA